MPSHLIGVRCPDPSCGATTAIIGTWNRKPEPLTTSEFPYVIRVTRYRRCARGHRFKQIHRITVHSPTHVLIEDITCAVSS